MSLALNKFSYHEFMIAGLRGLQLFAWFSPSGAPIFNTTARLRIEERLCFLNAEQLGTN